MDCRGPVLVLLLLVAPSPARAQFPVTSLNEQPEPMVGEALATPYGRLLTAQLAKSLSVAADPGCLSSNGITNDRLDERAGQLLQKWRTRSLETVLTMFDAKAYDEKFRPAQALGGPPNLAACATIPR